MINLSRALMLESRPLFPLTRGNAQRKCPEEAELRGKGENQQSENPTFSSVAELMLDVLCHYLLSKNTD